MRAQLHLDEPILVQYGRFVGNALRGDLGTSIRSRRPVTVEIAENVGSTAQLALAAVLVAVALGIPLGLVAALGRNSWLDVGSMAVALLGVSTREGLSDDELALFDLLFKDSISQADREKVKQASRALLASLQEVLRRMHDWTQNTATQAEVKIFILDTLWESLPRPPFSERDTEALAAQVYDYVWERSASGGFSVAA